MNLDLYQLTFAAKKEIGKQGEEATRKLYRRLAPSYEVLDVSADSYWQARDVDLLLVPPVRHLPITSIEVKTDRQMARTGNLFIELLTNS